SSSASPRPVSIAVQSVQRERLTSRIAIFLAPQPPHRTPVFAPASAAGPKQLPPSPHGAEPRTPSLAPSLSSPKEPSMVKATPSKSSPIASASANVNSAASSFNTSERLQSPSPKRVASSSQSSSSTQPICP